VTFYGAYIFDRTLSISAQVARDGGSFSASSSDKTTKAG
jgi:hypothetical protein